jgi:threonine/homoserine/homoserine lactone efflux protein
MDLSLTAGNAAALFLVMTVLAAVPSVSVMAVVARSASGGFVHGALATLGIVVGDVLFILLAVFGLVLLVETMGEFFVLVQLAGAGYLFWLGVALWRAGAGNREEGGSRPTRGGGLSSFMAGLLITLADQKAILFYLGFLPAFLDLAAVTAADTALLAVIAAVSVGGVKLVYAVASDRAGRRIGGRTSTLINRLAAAMLLSAGAILLARIG